MQIFRSDLYSIFLELSLGDNKVSLYPGVLGFCSTNCDHAMAVVACCCAHPSFKIYVFRSNYKQISKFQVISSILFNSNHCFNFLIYFSFNFEFRKCICLTLVYHHTSNAEKKCKKEIIFEGSGTGKNVHIKLIFLCTILT